MSGELILSGPGGDIQVHRDPSVVIAEATNAAKTLKDVIAGKAKDKKFIINGEQYLEFEDWQTVGRFYGVTAKIIWTRFIEFGGVHGFEARAVAIRADGAEISAAEAMCLNDEEKWSTRPKYEYLYVLKDGTKSKDDPGKDLIQWVANPKNPGKRMPKKVRELVGEEAVPLFQLRSMAQTRACAKALRNVLAWVVVLAGYRTTPVEEMEKLEPQGDGRPGIPDARVKEAIELLTKEGGLNAAKMRIKKNPPEWTLEDLATIQDLLPAFIFSGPESTPESDEAA